ncbi:pentatricopeptide repeat-containing protein At4g17616 [Phalaenopsis equestris]|uniref:pentatricopeptide repeat-containing protein At4g17616 n=1 Tax=Phalaenopsis equestris TaxID=78828 RepID=UPI0009E47665|nr:pentatricopeptide repeat-containing protein At4g17616 [Phalaenopsis equestris]XP_020586246.1 pentatricopeptide repeat-containing protein At4g17616 [Phalaenopsis equestris]XP_020586248.1 pentatricopeptide repeat-containing protein At4g17616 [Phalaenopsis equestris]XP_020586249.1 pentatricopeptide repeat-containing protein At4g17616 [Phalaenopsis equestris]XP_020586250.1 pentatricopeptide repeat-containing protein At4g17616 [Phalaenopsis equestris]
MRVFYWFYQLSQKISCMGLQARPACWIIVNSGRSSSSILSHGWHHEFGRYQKLNFSSNISHISGTTQSVLSWESSLCESPLRKLEAALEENSVDDAWEVFCSYKSLHGFPKQVLVKKMINLMTCSLSSHWLLKAYQLVLLVLYKSPHLLDYDSLTRLALVLARSQMPVPASTIMRISLDRFKFPSFNLVSTLFYHLVKSDIGSYLASNILIEICEQCLHKKADTKNSKQLKLINQSITMFNLVLNSCSKFESFEKALLIIKFMSQIGVAADANSIIIFGRIYEKLGQHDELMRLKAHVDSVVYVGLSRHYAQFYDSLLNLLFRCNDLNTAMEVMLDLYGRPKSFQCGDGLNALKNGLRKPCVLQIGSNNLAMGYKIVIEPDHLGSDFILDPSDPSTLVLFYDGKVAPSTMALSKLINGFVKERRVGEISKFLIEMEKKLDSKDASFSTFVLAACMKLGWLETVHDVLDDLESVGISVEAILYKSLFQAYRKKNLIGESKVVLKQMRKIGLFANLSDEDAVSSCLSGDFSIKPLENKQYFVGNISCFVGHLSRESRDKDSISPLVYDFNSTILFFCKANMMEDAIKTLKRMQQKNIHPTIQTFSYLLNGYSSLKMYRQITILWGEIKRRFEDGVLSVHQDFLDCLLMNFLRGGYFERVMEIVNYMIRHNIFADKWKYKEEFLRLHKDLYRNLKAANAKTDAQRNRLEHVQAFRKWANIVSR